MNKEKKEIGNEKIQSMVDISNHEEISDRYDDFGEKECPLADEMLSLEQKAKNENSEVREILGNKSTGVDSMIKQDINQEHINIDLKEKDSCKDFSKNSGEIKINLTQEEKALCTFDGLDHEKDLNSEPSSNQPKKSNNENVILIPEEENNNYSENILIGKKTNRENELQEERKPLEEVEFNNYDCFEDLFNNMTYRDGEDGDRLESSLINFSEINCNIIRYNSDYSPHIEDIQDEPEFSARDHAPFGTYLQSCYFNSTSHGTSPKPND
jgi:hypothetical protein